MRTDHLSSIKSFLSRVAARETAGWFLVDCGDEKPLFVEKLPLDHVGHVAVDARDAIDLHWRASGRKERRRYTLVVKGPQQEIVKMRSIEREAEQTTAQDLYDQAAAVSLQTVKGAADTIKQPYDQQKEVIATLIAENARLSARCKDLEAQNFQYCDRLMSHAEKASEGHVHAAHVTAIQQESQAKIAVYQQVGGTVTTMVPRLIGMAVKMLGKDKAAQLLSGMPASPALGAPPIVVEAEPKPAGKSAPAVITVEPVKVEPPRQTMTPETAAKLRALGGKLSDVELSRLLKNAWDLDPDGNLLKQLEPAHVQEAFGILAELASQWGV